MVDAIGDEIRGDNKVLDCWSGSVVGVEGGVNQAAAVLGNGTIYGSEVRSITLIKPFLFAIMIVLS